MAEAQEQKPIPVNGRAEIRSDDGGKTAVIILHAPQNGGAFVTEQLVREELERSGIVHGVDEAAYKNLISG